MKTNTTSFAVFAAVLTSVVLLAFSLRAHDTNDRRAADYGLLVERGNYLVNNVGMCADCHTPRNERGEFLMQLWLEGSALPFQPTVPMPWSPAAPPIAGLRSMTDEQA